MTKNSTERRFLALGLSIMIWMAAACGGTTTETTVGEGTTTTGDQATETTVDESTTTTAAAAPEGETVVVALVDTVASLDPQFREAPERLIWTYNYYEPLVGRDGTGALVPVLAASMPEHVDETTWRVPIREGVTFENGEPFDAAAAAFSVNRIIDPDYGSELLSRISTITGATVVDDFTIDVTTDGLDPILPARLGHIMMIPPEYALDEKFASEPSGTGPYVWVSGSGDGPIVMETNPDYWGGPSDSNITRVEFRVIPDESTRIAAVQAGEVDLITRIPPDAVPILPQALSASSAENVIVILNTAAGIATDVRVREALNLAIDKEALAVDLWEGYANPMPCGVAVMPGALGFPDGRDPVPYDPDRARQLLEEAGVSGQEITFVGAGDVFNLGREMAEVIASYWREVGLEVDLLLAEFDPYLEALYAKGEARPDAVYLSTTTEFADADTGVQRVYVSTAEAAGYSNPEIDALAASARTSGDPAEREALYAELFDLACQDYALVFLLHPEQIYGATARLNFVPRIDERIVFSDMSVEE